jgi:capsule polysaccharide export protein KpsE/RkpR
MTGKLRSTTDSLSERENFDFTRRGGNGGTDPDPFPANGGTQRNQADAIAKLRLLWNRRAFLGKSTLYGLLLFLAIALVIPVRYESVAKLMPPDSSSGGLGMMLSALTGGGSSSGSSGGGGGALASVGSDLLGLKTTGDLFAGVLQSRTVEDDLIQKFDLRKVYGTGTFGAARKRLSSLTEINIDKKTGIIELGVVDHDRNRAAAMAQEYIAQLNHVLVDLNTGSAHRERVFLEGRLSQVNQDLETSEKAFSQFSSKEGALDIKEQGKAMLEAAGQLEGELIGAETTLQGLEQIYTPTNVRVRSTQARIDELKRQILKMGGKPEGSSLSRATADNGQGSADGSPATADSSQGAPSSSATTETQNLDALYPSIRKLPLLGVSYADLLRRTKVEEAIFETLTREYELAKVQEAKELPSVKVLDAPDVPEKKSFPPRSLLTLLGALLGLSTAIAWTFGTRGWDTRDASDPAKALALEVFTTVRGSLQGMLHNGTRNGQADRTVVPSEETRPGVGREGRG